MSLDAMTWALSKAPVDDPMHVVLLIALADRAKDDGTASWPSQKWLSVRGRCSVRTVRRHLSAMEESGIIRRGDQRLTQHLRSDKRPIVWDLAVDNQVDLAERQDTGDRAVNLSGGTSEAERQDTGDQSDRTLLAYNTSLDTSLKPITARSVPVRKTAVKRNSYTAEFEEFWSIYPSALDKYPAAAAYKRAMKVRPHPDLVKAALAYRDDPNRKPDFTCRAATWLNQHRWENELTASPADVNEWLRQMYRDGTAKPVEERSGLRLPLEYQPESDPTPARDWQMQRRRAWITDNHAAIVAAIGEREQ